MAHPLFLYGTAWKDERTAALTRAAIEAGFRGVDTANQRRHYFEQGVGDALEAVYREGGVARADLFLQTKFTHMGGQDHRLPYDPGADLPTQVRQSFASSLEHLRTDYLDSYVLHGPSVGRGLSEADWSVWRAMEGLHRDGKARMLGVSNVSLGQLHLLTQGAQVQPRFVQNRCFAVNQWDREVRAFCAERDIVYQGFSLLTANVHVLTGPEMVSLARRHRKTIAQLVFRFAQQVGMLPLTGTTDVEHMREDLASTSFDLAEDEVALIESIGAR